MAKTTAPLFSMAASGTVARALSFRIARGQQIAQAPKIRPSRVSARLASTQGRWQQACQHWYALTEADRDEWRAQAIIQALPPLALWCKEWMMQDATPTTPPLLPIAP